ncbi:trypsin-like [Lytechinus pictus]|uniref:trypsin-like n=1 Tax=Lytechinus pictus TaxID=7653 RepID=UPI0030B9E6BD
MLKFFVLACALGAIQAMIQIGDQFCVNCGDPAINPDETAALIVGGKEAKPNSWPWQTLVLSGGRHICGATLIDKDWIVCAAHCFGKTPQISDYSFALGVHDKSSGSESSRQDYTAAEIFVHENYQSSTTNNDIALIKLSQSVTCTDEISTACLVSARPNDNDMAFVTGWGTLSSGGFTPRRLNQVQVPVVSDDTCKKAYRLSYNPDTMVCAGYPEGGKDSCQGDSGGPMVVKNQQTGLWELGGIVSWGYGCAEAGNYGVYTNVANYLGWISNIMANN